MINPTEAPACRRQKPGRPLTSGKLWAFRAAAILIAAATIELFSLGIWHLWMPNELRILSDQLRDVRRIGSERRGGVEALHPYVGWVLNPDSEDLPPDLKGKFGINSLGFVDDASTIQKRSPDAFLVGVFGGSVAQQMGTIGEQSFLNRLKEDPRLAGKQIKIVRLAMSGYKQPQQLMALNYAFALGAEFDFVVNVDGYNESGLVVGENLNSHVFIGYPSSWKARVMDVVDPTNSSVSYQLLRIRAYRQQNAEFVASTWLRYSSTATLIWHFREASLKHQLIVIGSELRSRIRKRGKGFAIEGPRQFSTEPEQQYEQMTEIWFNSSRQMRDLCSARGIGYLHVLQPNQYLPGSKVLSNEEETRYYAPHEDHAVGVRNGYPKLLKASERFKDYGVSFKDLTQLFVNERDTIYSDFFCHYNSRGTNMLAEAVANEITLQMQGGE